VPALPPELTLPPELNELPPPSEPQPTQPARAAADSAAAVIVMRFTFSFLSQPTKRQTPPLQGTELQQFALV
jgi:hypothetical protein